MLNDIPLLVAVCAVSLVCVGGLLVIAYLLFGFTLGSLGGIADRYAEDDDETDSRRGRRRRTSLRASAPSFDDALARSQQSGGQAESRPRRTLKPNLGDDDFSDRLGRSRRRRRDENDPDEIADLLDDEESADFL